MINVFSSWNLPGVLLNNRQTLEGKRALMALMIMAKTKHTKFILPIRLYFITFFKSNLHNIKFDICTYNTYTYKHSFCKLIILLMRIIKGLTIFIFIIKLPMRCVWNINILRQKAECNIYESHTYIFILNV